MALQDLTPQLRTRMTRVERVVGLFVIVAALLMAAAFAYYLITTGQRRGWFINKVPYYCYTRDATGLKPGDPVRLLGREVGRIVRVEACPTDPWFFNNGYNVFVKFEIWEPYFGYIWTDSKVKILSADFFGSRYLEVTRGTNDLAYATVTVNPRRFEDSLVINDKNPENGDETNRIPLRVVKEGVWLKTDEAPSVSQHGEQIVRTLSEALPHLTRQIATVLDHTGAATSNANLALLHLHPTLQSLETLAARLPAEDGVLGRLLLTTNLQVQTETMLGSMDTMVTNTTALIRTSERQLQDLTRRLALTLDNVALVTSNLSAQVQANSLVLGEVSSLVVGADDMVQGLKRHWLLRSAFAGATNAPLESLVAPRLDEPRR